MLYCIVLYKHILNVVEVQLPHGSCATRVRK